MSNTGHDAGVSMDELAAAVNEVAAAMNGKRAVRHAARIHVSMELIARALHMPEGTHIYLIRPHEWKDGTFVFFLSHPDLPAVAEGGIPDLIAPVLTRTEAGVEWDWNLPKDENHGSQNEVIHSAET